MSSYSMVGNGSFGGSGNFLANLGGIGRAWGDGIASGMQMGTAMQTYNNFINTSPSSVRAQIAQNIASQGQHEGEHYRNYMMNDILSALAGGQNLSGRQQEMIDKGYVQGIGSPNVGGTTANVAGTPAQQPTPNTQSAKPAQVTTAPIPTTAGANTAGFNPQSIWNSLLGYPQAQQPMTQFPYRG